ncbi:hypothetical protein RUND412_005666 [Rhizina undulata]
MFAGSVTSIVTVDLASKCSLEGLIKDRIFDKDSYSRYNWVLVTFNLFHLYMNLLKTILCTHYGLSSSNDPASLRHDAILLNRKHIAQKTVDVYAAEELILDSLASQLLDVLFSNQTISSLPELQLKLDVMSEESFLGLLDGLADDFLSPYSVE